MKSGANSTITIPAENKPTHKGWLSVCPVLIADTFWDSPVVRG